MMKVQARKPWQANWEHVEILALVQAKKEKHKEMIVEMDN
jgi:hypothetical protein